MGLVLTLADGGQDDGPLLELAEPAGLPEPTAGELAQLLAETYPVTPEQRASFARDGFVELPGVLPPAAAVGRLCRLLVEHLAAEHRERPAGRFTSDELMWTRSGEIAENVLSRRLGRLVADLLDVADVGIHHDNVLAKEPACGRSLWHFDDHHFPIDSQRVATVWLPLQPTPRRGRGRGRSSTPR